MYGAAAGSPARRTTAARSPAQAAPGACCCVAGAGRASAGSAPAPARAGRAGRPDRCASQERRETRAPKHPRPHLRRIPARPRADERKVGCGGQRAGHFRRVRRRVPVIVLFVLSSACDERLGEPPPASSSESESLPAPEPDTRPEPETVTAAVQTPASVCPAEMALVDARFCIDRWEAATLREDGVLHSPYHAVTYEKVRAESRPGEVPQAYISMEEADLACGRAGKRLCTTQQWVDACRGSGKQRRRYPYGSAEQPGACNTRQGGPHPLMALHFGRRPTDSWAMNDPLINQVSSTVAPAGAFEACVTPDGVSDLVGNLHEWTRGDRPLLMGGYYLDAKENGEGCSYVTMRHGEKYHDFSTGFRCCLEPDKRVLRAEPATQPAALTTKTVPPPAPVSSDPAGFRSFQDPAAPLPPKPSPPPYEPADAACPTDMLLVDGLRCASPEQECLRWLDVPGQEPDAPAPSSSSRACARGRSCRCATASTATSTRPGAGRSPSSTSPGARRRTSVMRWTSAFASRKSGSSPAKGPRLGPTRMASCVTATACNHDLPELFTPRQKLYDKRVPAESLARLQEPLRRLQPGGQRRRVDLETQPRSTVALDPARRLVADGAQPLPSRHREPQRDLRRVANQLPML